MTVAAPNKSLPLQTLTDPAQPAHTLHLAHANGFPPACYRGLAAALPASYQVVALPARPLWTPPPPPEDFHSWETMADDLLAGLDQHGLEQVIGMGHSMGGTASIMASIKQPQRFKALVLLDPTLLPRWVLWITRLMKIVPGLQVPLVRQALTRKRRWESEEAALARYRPRQLFARWPDGVLRDYVQAISRPAANGDGLELAYPPEWEARIYATLPFDVWGYVPRISVPTLVIRGAETNTFTAQSAAHWQRLRPDIPIITVPETTHFVPMEAPQVVAGHIQRFVEGLD